MNFSRRSACSTAANSIARALDAHTGPLLDLTIGNPTLAGFDVPAAAADAIGRGAREPYRPAPFGLLDGRTAVGESVGVAADRIVLCASTSEAYGFLFKLLCDPGDAVLVPRPGYPLFDHLARFCAVRPTSYPLYHDGEWCIDRAAVQRALTPKTRAIVLVSPANPTGSCTRAADLRWLRTLGLPIISDEVFADFLLEPATDGVTSVLPSPDGLVFALGGLSKSAGFPGAKLGWIAIDGPDAAVREAMRRLELIGDTWLSAGTAVQQAASELIAIGATRRAAILSRLRTNLCALRESLRGSAATVPRVEGGWYAPIRLPATQTDTQWALGLLAAGLRVQPGWFYDFGEGTWVVVSLLTPEADFAAGIALLRRQMPAEAD